MVISFLWHDPPNKTKRTSDSIDEIPKLMRERFFRKMIQHVNIYRFVYFIGNLYTNGLIDTIEIKLFVWVCVCVCGAKRNSRLLFNIKDTSQQHTSHLKIRFNGPFLFSLHFILFYFLVIVSTLETRESNNGTQSS